eukprot:tig00020927_g15988.t1
MSQPVVSANAGGGNNFEGSIADLALKFTVALLVFVLVVVSIFIAIRFCRKKSADPEEEAKKLPPHLRYAQMD